jgi:hypothetical protein
VAEKTRKATQFRSIAMFIAELDGSLGRAPSDGPTTSTENGIMTSCNANRNRAQFHGHNGVLAIGRQRGISDITTAKVAALAIAPMYRCSSGDK